jgi:adenylate cyclase
MNLFLKSYKVYLIFFLILALKGSELLGNRQDSIHFLSPRILKYRLPSKHFKTANTSFYKSDQGVIFIGTKNGLMILDGSSSYFTSMEGPVYIAASSGQIHYLASNDFGTIDYNPSFGIQKNSHIDDINSHNALFLPYNLISKDSLLIMATSAGVFINKGDQYEHLFFRRQECKLLKTNESIFLDVCNEGLYIWRDTAFVIALNSSDFNNELIAGIFESDDQYKILTSSGESYVCDKSFSSISRAEACSIRGGEIQQLETLPDGNQLITTVDNKIYIYSADGEIINAPGEAGVLPSTPIKDIFIDEFNDIWLLYIFDLYKLEYPSHVYSLRLPKSVAGNVLETLVIGDFIYLGTTSGLIILETLQHEQWVWNAKKQFDNEYINLLRNVDDIVYAAGNKSLYEINGDNLMRISEGDFSGLNAINNELVIGCNKEGIEKFSKVNGVWTKKMINPDHSYVLDMKFFMNRIWLIGEDNRVTSINYKNEAFIEYELLMDKADQFVVIDDQLYIIGLHSLWFWNEEKQKFIEHEDEALISFFLNSDIIRDGSDEIWMLNHQDENDFYIYTYNIEDGARPFNGVSPTQDFDLITGINQSGETLWLSGEDQLFRVSLNFSSDTLRNTIRIEKVCKYSTKTKCTTVSENDRLPYSKDIITFSLDNIRYQNDPAPYYRYKLSHYQNQWSDWSQVKQIQFSGLSGRNYFFQAQSRTISGGVSDTVEFRFSIQDPFYRMWYAYLIYGIVLLSTIFLLLKWRLLSYQRVTSRVEAENKDKMDSILREKEKADKLVSDMFPKGTAEELKSSGRAKSEKYEMATVLFSDIQGFTKIAEEMNPEVLIDELDKFFFTFDSVVEKYNIEKIKTIGDAYMAAGGIPIKNSTNPVEVVLAGLEVQQYMNDLKKSKTDIWGLRIGIHTGPVISGVVGHKKLSYDIWGDTVNTASRMESSGEGGKVNISGTTYSMVKDYFICEYRGKLPVKYKGNIDMYFVTGLRPELSVDLKGTPNRRFFLKVQLLRMRDLESKVFNDLLDEHPGTFHFHTRDHIRQIFNQTELLCRAENIAEEDTLLTLSASLLIYVGLSDSYERSENKSVDMAREILPEFYYSEKQIDTICNLILSTKKPYEPQNKLESILIDAKMEYLGRPDFSKSIKLLYLELKSNERAVPMQKLVKEQISILRDFAYFTVAGQRLREVSGEDQIKNLESEE